MIDVHPEKPRDMEFPGRSERELIAAALGIAHRQDVAVPLARWSVRDLGDDRAQVRAARGVAVVHAQRIEGVAERAKLGQQADRSRRPLSRLARYETPNGAVERFVGVAEVMITTSSNRCRSPALSTTSTASERR